MKWLVKEEPANYPFSQFVKDGRTVWSGVKNPVAQRHLRGMTPGDQVFYYHTGSEKAVVGIARVATTPQPTRRMARASSTLWSWCPARRSSSR